MASKPIPFKEYKQIFSKVTRFCIEVVLRNSDGVVLLLRKSGGWENMWHFAGGMVLFKESLHDAVTRVAKEELGVEVNVVKFLDFMEFHDEEKERGYGYTISAAFLCDYVSGGLTFDEDSQGVKAFKEIPSEIVPEHGDLLRKHWEEIKV